MPRVFFVFRFAFAVSQHVRPVARMRAPHWIRAPDRANLLRWRTLCRQELPVFSAVTARRVRWFGGDLRCGVISSSQIFPRESFTLNTAFRDRPPRSVSG